MEPAPAEELAELEAGVEEPDMPPVAECVPGDELEAPPAGEDADEPADAPGPDDPAAVEPPPTVGLAFGCMAEEPDVVDPEPVAAGRSVPPDGPIDCAKAGAAPSAVATRQAAICVFNIAVS